MSETDLARPGNLLAALAAAGVPLPGAGGLGLVLARAGVGKSTFLVQLGLGEALEGRDVLHVALGESVKQVEARYRPRLAERTSDGDPIARDTAMQALRQHRAIQALGQDEFTPDGLRRAIDTYRLHLDLRPTVVLVDGYDWDRMVAATPERLRELKTAVGQHGASLWLTGRTPREVTLGAAALPAPYDEVAPAVNLALFLEPTEERIDVHVAAALGQTLPEVPVASLAPVTLRPLVEGDDAAGSGPAVERCVLMSGGAAGSEAAFGGCAERWGLAERNFTFAGRQTARQRGLVELGPDELLQGDVSWAYLARRLRRHLTRSEEKRKVLQTIWHQVRGAEAVYAIGVIQTHGAVTGGTGWAVELAKHQHKPVWVFDQDQEAWFRWVREAWQPAPPPLLQYRHFVGTGTRNLSDAGRAAIEGLFTRTFGPPQGTAEA